MVVSSVIIPASSKSPANLSRPPKRLSSSVLREIVLPESVDNVPEIAKSLCSANSVPTSVTPEVLSTVPPIVSLPPDESSQELEPRVSVSIRCRSASPVYIVTELSSRGSSNFKSVASFPRVKLLPLCSKVLNVFSPLNVTVTSSSKFRTDISLVISVPFPVARSPCNFRVVPLTSRLPLLSSAPP